MFRVFRIWRSEEALPALFAFGKDECADDITLNLDYATSGVGDTSRGILVAYRVFPTAISRTLTIRPVRQ